MEKTLSGQVSDWVQIDAHVKNPFRSGPPSIVKTSQNPFTSLPNSWSGEAQLCNSIQEVKVTSESF